MTLLDVFRRGRLRQPQHYDKGWVPGPNANWQKRSPDEMAKSLSSGQSKQSSSPQSLAPKQQNPQSQVVARPPESKPLGDKEVSGNGAKVAPLGAAPPQAADVAKMDDAQLSKLIEEHKANPEKPKRVRDRANEPHYSLREVVKRFGGINLGSLEASGFDVKALMESGLAWRGLFRRDGGLDVSEMAGQLHNEGHIEIPGVEHHGEVKGANASKTLPKEAAQFMLDNLVAKVKSLHAIKDAEFKKSYQNYLKELKNADAEESEIAEAVRSGEADGQAEAGNGDSLGDDPEMAEGGGQGDETGATEVGDFDPSKFQRTRGGERYNKGWVPGPDAHWEKVHPDEMAKRLGRRTVHDELKSRGGPAQESEPKPEPKTEPAAEQPQAAPQAMKSPDELAKSLPPSAPAKQPEQPAAPPAQPQAAAAPKQKVSQSEAMHLFSSLPTDPQTGYPQIVTKAVGWIMKNNPAADRDELLSQSSEAVWKTAMSMGIGEQGFENKAKAAINNAIASEGRQRTAQKRDVGRTKPMQEGFDAPQPASEGPSEMDVQEAVAKLSPAQQHIVQGKMAGKNYVEIGKELGMSPASITREWQEAVKVLKPALEYQAEGAPTRYMNTEHVPAGSPEGGQFTGKGEHGQSPDDMAAKISQPKAPHQMSRKEHIAAAEAQHKAAVGEYLAGGGEVTPEIAADYPDLAAQHGYAAQAAQSPTAQVQVPVDNAVVAKHLGTVKQLWNDSVTNLSPNIPAAMAELGKLPNGELAAIALGFLPQENDEMSKKHWAGQVTKLSRPKLVKAIQDKIQATWKAKQANRFEMNSEPTRYSAPLLPEVWQEILTQARGYGPMGPEFIRSVMEAMQHTESQWEAIQEGRRAFLRHGSQRHEYGPRHQPKKRLDGAVARLSALAEYAGEIDDEALEDEVIGISREFSAEDLKAIARAFGIKRGISTKAATLQSLLDKVCEGKGD